MTESAHSEVERGERFAFGANWARFLESLDDRRIAQGEIGLTSLLGYERLDGKKFLDIGSGSGLSSLAARRLGATVRSFDFDNDSVGCTTELRRRYFPDDANWEAGHGSALDEKFMVSLGTYDIVYSWGVLHHTGQMWQAIENAIARVAPGGTFFIALYNDQGRASVWWKRIKRSYCKLPESLKFLILWPAFIRLWGPTLVRDTLNGSPLRTWKNYYTERGMTPWRDVVDWVGGYPFEVASPEEVFDFCKERGFRLEKIHTVTGLGCNEFVFIKER